MADGLALKSPGASFAYFTIGDDGSFSFKSTAGTTLFAGDTSGNLTVYGGITTPNTTDDYGTAGIKADVLQGSTGTTGNFALSLVDNLADAFSIKQSTNSYLTFVTTNGSESIDASKTVRLLSGATIVDSIHATVTAAAGSVTGDAAVLPTGGRAYKVTGADGTKGVRIHASDAVLGREILILNLGGGTLKVYPPTGGTINGNAADVASTGTKSFLVICTDVATLQFALI